MQIALFWARYGVSDYEDIEGRDIQEIVADLHTLGTTHFYKICK